MRDLITESWRGSPAGRPPAHWPVEYLPIEQRTEIETKRVRRLLKVASQPRVIHGRNPRHEYMKEASHVTLVESTAAVE